MSLAEHSDSTECAGPPRARGRENPALSSVLIRRPAGAVGPGVVGGEMEELYSELGSLRNNYTRGGWCILVENVLSPAAVASGLGQTEFLSGGGPGAGHRAPAALALRGGWDA